MHLRPMLVLPRLPQPNPMATERFRTTIRTMMNRRKTSRPTRMPRSTTAIIKMATITTALHRMSMDMSANHSPLHSPSNPRRQSSSAGCGTGKRSLPVLACEWTPRLLAGRTATFLGTASPCARSHWPTALASATRARLRWRVPHRRSAHRQQFSNRIAVGQDRHGAAGEVVEGSLRIDVEMLQHRGPQVVRR